MLLKTGKLIEWHLLHYSIWSGWTIQLNRHDQIPHWMHFPQGRICNSYKRRTYIGMSTGLQRNKEIQNNRSRVVLEELNSRIYHSISIRRCSFVNLCEKYIFFNKILTSFAKIVFEFDWFTLSVTKSIILIPLLENNGYMERIFTNTQTKCEFTSHGC